MSIMSRRIAIFLAFAVATGLLTLKPTPANDLLTALRSGGFVILLRHGGTVGDQTDRVPFDFDDITAQRNLNEQGKALARSFGDALREAGVPVGKVFTSRFNRAHETATSAGFKTIERTDDLTLAYGPNGLVITLPMVFGTFLRPILYPIAAISTLAALFSGNRAKITVQLSRCRRRPLRALQQAT